MRNQYNLGYSMVKFMEIINSSTTAFRKGQINTSELPRSPFHFLKPMFPERRHSSQTCYAHCNPCFINFMSIIGAVCSLFFCFCNAFPKEQTSIKQPARSGLFFLHKLEPVLEVQGWSSLNGIIKISAPSPSHILPTHPSTLHVCKIIHEAEQQRVQDAIQASAGGRGS